MRSPMHSTVRRAITCASESKSKIGVCIILKASAVAIGPIEITGHIGASRLREPGEAAIIAGAAQAIDLALSEVLVAAADRLGHVDIFDAGPGAERRIGRQH